MNNLKWFYLCQYLLTNYFPLWETRQKSGLIVIRVSPNYGYFSDIWKIKKAMLVRIWYIKTIPMITPSAIYSNYNIQQNIKKLWRNKTTLFLTTKSFQVSFHNHLVNKHFTGVYKFLSRRPIGHAKNWVLKTNYTSDRNTTRKLLFALCYLNSTYNFYF